MIRKLIQRDPAWKAAPWCALASAVAWACPSPAPEMLGPFVIAGCLVGAVPHLRATAFDAALPIEPRDLVLARSLSMLWLIWVSVAAGIGGALLGKGFAALTPGIVVVGALLTLCVGIAQSVRPKKLAGPHWVFYVLFMVVFWLSAARVMDRVGVLPSALCALAGVGLLAWAWRSAPGLFQFAPAEAKAGQAAPEAAGPVERGGQAFAWSPVLRSAWSWQYLLFVVMEGVSTASGAWPFIILWVAGAWVGSRARVRWLWALPVARRALLWTLLGPILVATGVGFVAGLHRRPALLEAPRTTMVITAALVAWILVSVLVSLLLDWRRVPKRPRERIFFVVLGVWYAAVMAVLLFTPWRDTLMRDALVTFSRTMPFSLPVLAAAASALLIALYAAVENVFREPDFADKPKVQSADARIAG